MAIGDPYALPAELEDRLGTTDDGTYTGLLAAASRHVEWYTGRQFNREESATARRYRALDPERVATDDFWDLTGLVVTVDGTVWDAADYDPRPWDGETFYGSDRPYTDLFAVGRTWPTTNFRRATIEVTAKWGWADVPAAVVEATLDVAEIMSTGAGVSSGGSFVMSERIGDVSVGFGTPRYDLGHKDVPRALAKADPYRRKRFGVG